MKDWLPAARWLRAHLPHLLSIAAVGWAMVWFWGTAVSTAWARIAALQTIEPYAFAVHEQLLYNFATEGEFFQTIHRGYVDNWAWSGHRAPTLPLTGLLYGLAPQPLWLAQIMLTGVLLGAIPAALIGKRAMGSGWGLAWGGLAYLSFPPTMVMALQDYQDMVYALPALTFAVWALGSGRWWLSVLGAVVAILPREECVPMGIAIALLVPPWRALLPGMPLHKLRPRWRLWAFNIAAALAIAAAYTAWAERAYPIDESGYQMPLLNAVGGLGGQSGGAIFLEGWGYIEPFYSLLWVPLGVLAILSPALVLPAAGLVLFHMAIPEGMGVDRSWSGHSHHLAPAAAFAICAIIQGGGRLLWLVGRIPRVGKLAAVATCAGLLGWAGQHLSSWAQYYNLVVSASPRPPVWEHPAWALVRMLPDDAVPIASKDLSLAISNRTRSYTYDESLPQKAPRWGLAAGTHLIVDRRLTDIVAWGEAMEGAEVVGESGPFALLTWSPSARDPRAGQRVRAGRVQPWIGDFRTAGAIPGVPPHEPRRDVPMGSFPVIDLR